MPFSTDLIVAILEDRKTMTRRVIKPQPTDINQIRKTTFDGFSFAFTDGLEYAELGKGVFCHRKPRYKIGDILYAQETWGIGIQMTGGIIYKADYADTPKNKIPLAEGEKWKSSRFMPKAAARLFLQVTDVRVERLQEITASDALKEGVINNFATCLVSLNAEADNTIAGFRKLWDKVYRSYQADFNAMWNGNPWVFAYSFERIVSGTGVEG
jgi:hypothetical protein